MMRRGGLSSPLLSTSGTAGGLLRERLVVGRSLPAAPALSQRRPLSLPSNPFRRAPKQGVKLDEKLYDKQNVHYTGTVFGVPMESLVYSLKLSGTMLAVTAILYLFFKGSMYLTGFSLATVGKMGFASGFASAVALSSAAGMMRRRYHIPANAVYNQAIALVMRNPKVAEFLGQYPKTGNFRAYHAEGGFKLPLLRRLRSGQYELSDMLGTKPRKLSMMFTLRNESGRHGVVTCEVRKAEGSLFASSYYFHSLAVHLADPATKTKEAVMIIGDKEDAVVPGLLNF